MNPDFAEILSELTAAGAEFIVVGAFAVAAHGNPRATGDIDLWVRRRARPGARAAGTSGIRCAVVRRRENDDALMLESGCTRLWALGSRGAAGAVARAGVR